MVEDRRRKPRACVPSCIANLVKATKKHVEILDS
jgi:hypothetical protein